MFLQEIEGIAFSLQVQSVIYGFKMAPLQTGAMNVQNCLISRHTPQVYNPSLSFSSISLPLISPKKQRCMPGRHHNYLH